MAMSMSKAAMRRERVRLTARADALFDARHVASILAMTVERNSATGESLRALDEKLHRMEMEAHRELDALDMAEAGGDEG